MKLQEPRLVRTGNPGPLSESIITAVPGKYYAYQSVFTDRKPLYALLDCKANKSRELAQAGELGREVHLHFGFGDSALASVSSIFDDVWVAPAGITIEDFYILCARRDSARLADICKASCMEHKASTDVAPGTIIALMTSAGKYGLFLTTALTPTSVSIDACHVLLP